MVWEKKPIAADVFANSEMTERYATTYNGESMELFVVSGYDTVGDVDYSATSSIYMDPGWSWWTPLALPRQRCTE